MALAGLAPVLRDREVVVLGGAGGVGKTTVSAALAVALARAGDRACVLTIDPARRLADALGVALDGQPRAVPLPGAPGSLDALMLDVKATFDGVIAEHAPSAERRDAILRNRIYRSLSGSIAGLQEYMAMERLHELVQGGRYDRIVLDTPPAQNALDFLDAPGRLIRFLEGRSLRMLLRPGVRAGRLGARLAGRGAAVGMSLLERVTGVALLHDLSEFFMAFEDMLDGFRRRAHEVEQLLASSRTTFLVVTAPAREPIAEAERLVAALRERSLPFGALVANRVSASPLPGGEDGVAFVADHGVAALVAAGVAPEVARAAARALADEEDRARREAGLLADLEARLGGVPSVRLPLLGDGVIGAEALASLALPLGVAAVGG